MFYWYVGMILFSLINICLLIRCWRKPSVYLLLPTAFTLICAFRACLPRVDVERFVLCDHTLSSIFIGRALATIAEVCFASQWIILTRNRWCWCLLSLVVGAEVASWYATLTANCFGNVVEESCWAIASTVVCIVLFKQGRDFWGLLVGLYVVFLLQVDIPMYAARMNGVYTSLSDGVSDAWGRRIYTWSWEHWYHEVPWMTAYFVVGPWVSMLMLRIRVSEKKINN